MGMSAETEISHRACSVFRRPTSPMHVAKKKNTIAEEATWRGGGQQHSVRDGARAAARPAIGHLFRGRGCEAAGVKPIMIYHYVKDKVIPSSPEKVAMARKGLALSRRNSSTACVI